MALLYLLERHGCTDYRIIAIDLLEARRQKAERIVQQIGSVSGSVKIAGGDEAKGTVNEWTDGVGCIAVIEVCNSHAFGTIRSHMPMLLDTTLL